MKNDTIVAVSSALGMSAISIIRMSGDDTFEIIKKVFKGPDLNKVDTHTIQYGHIYDGQNILDEVLIFVFKSPKSFTREDVIEISCHGGAYVTHKILALLIKEGARLAEKGEFTERAFLNGRIDLTQAESIMDIIESRSDLSLQLANKGLNGVIKTLIETIREDLLTIIAHIEVNIDYPEYDDIEELTTHTILPKTKALIEQMTLILAKADDGRLIREGIKTAIIGRPNVGKSSLLNALLKEEKAIVTEVLGTTRDIVEGYLNLGGVTLHLLDTAGIREAENLVEKIGIDKAKEALKNAELILFVLDNNQPLNQEDENLLLLTKDKKRIIIINKIDLKSQIGTTFENSIQISALNKTNIDALEEKIKTMLFSSEIALDDTIYLSNTRHIGLMNVALKSLQDATASSNKGVPIDMVEIDLKNAYDTLGEIIGDTHTTTLLDTLFSRFCLGK